MQAKPIYDYVYFGTVLRYLEEATEGRHIHDEGSILPNLSKLLENLKKLDLEVTCQSDAYFYLCEIKTELESLPKDSTITKEQAIRIGDYTSDLKKFIYAETGAMNTYTVERKRLDEKKLINDIGGFFTPGTYEKLPLIARTDLKDAGKCIAFDLPTSAAFHILRATEGILRVVYCTYVKQNRVSPLMWGNMLDSLQTKRKKPSAELLNHLRHIKDSFRNPTQHPDATYTIDDAQDLFSVSIDVVNRMARLLP